VRVTTFDSKGRPGIVQNFLAYEADKERAIELVRKRVPVHEGELAEAVAEVGADELIGERMRPGDVRRDRAPSRSMLGASAPCRVRRLAYRYPIVSSPDASGVGTSIAIKDVARGSVVNLGKPMPCATSPLASSSE
jgi:hypothetical protein